MSFRFLYRRIPVSERVCSYYKCRSQILRNIARTSDGRIWHYGCLMNARDEQYRCLECYATFDATEASFDTKQIIRGDFMAERLQPLCPHCGSQNLKPSGGLD